MKINWVLGLSTSALILFSAGCASSQSSKAKPLTLSSGAPVSLGNYRIATIEPFTVSAPGVDPSIGAKLANNITARLQNDFGPIFEQVRTAPAPVGEDDEVIVTGEIRTYQPGNKVARSVFGPLGSANFDGTVVVKDGRDGHTLLAAPFNKFWGWGGLAGASKGIEDMSDETAAAIASTIARARGWRPAMESSGQ